MALNLSRTVSTVVSTTDSITDSMVSTADSTVKAYGFSVAGSVVVSHVTSSAH